MRLCIPDKRWRDVQAALESSTPPDEEIAYRVYDALTGNSANADVGLAVSLIEDVEYRDHIVACVLSDVPQETIVICLGLPLAVVGLFSQLFMDLEAFRHKMEKRRYTQYYINKVCKTADAEQLIAKGRIEGQVAFETFWNNPDQQLTTPRPEMAKILTDIAFAKAITGRHADITGETAKEALKWSNSAVRYIVGEEDIQGTGTDELDAMVALETHEYTSTAEEMGLNPADLLH